MEVEFAYEDPKDKELPLVLGGVYVKGNETVLLMGADDVSLPDPYAIVPLSTGVMFGRYGTGYWFSATRVRSHLSGYRYVPDAKVFIPAEAAR